MTPPRTPLVIASLPARSLDEARPQAQAALDAGADVAELRFDLWPVAERRRMGELFPSPLPLLATLRSQAEGGEGPDASETRAAWVREVRALPFTWVDLEADRDAAALAGPSPTAGGWVLSSHLPAAAPIEQVHRRLARPRPGTTIAKVVVPAPISVALTQLVPALPPVGEGARTLHTTGASGALLRAWSRRLELASVYGALPESATSVAPVEASQIPVDRLRWFLDGPEEAPIFAVIGRPVGHSRSPALHARWMRALGDRGLYIALEFASDAELAEALPMLSAGGFRGLNITHPFKDAAFGLATRLGAGAVACGCANVLTLRDGEVEAENTDLLAILRRLEDLTREGRWDGRALTVLGTGGAARATLAAARSLGASAEVVGRTPGRVARLSHDFGATAAGPAHTASLVVNATTVGRGPGGPEALALEKRLGPSSLLLDWVYRPTEPALAEAARAAGAQYEEGRRLLAYSAAASYEIWWDHAPSADAVESALAEAV